MEKYNYTEEEIINYVNGEKVYSDFLNELEVNSNLQKKISSLRNDLFLMENIEDSNMFKELRKKSIINIKNNIVDYMLYFSRVSPLNARGNNDNKKIETYIYNNIEIEKNDDIFYINIRDIKKYCIIQHNGEKIVNIFGENDNYSTLLKEGTYFIKIDDYECNINISR